MEKKIMFGWIDILFGLLWGDEGKGKVIDFIAQKYHLIMRVNGGANAGHTIYLKIKGKIKQLVLHIIPSGVGNLKAILACGSGMAICPIDFWNELLNVKKFDPNIFQRIRISHQATLVTPIQVLKDELYENGSKEKPFGSTKKGIRFAYADDALHVGFRFEDLKKMSVKDFMQKYEKYKEQELRILTLLYPSINLEALIQRERLWFKRINQIRQDITIVDTCALANNILSEGKDVLLEGAQATLLDNRLGYYPYNTSSHTTPQMLLGYAGLPIQAVRDVIAVTKWYGTRVGGVNPPTTMSSKEDDIFREDGKEFGSTTGRPRICAWPDFVMMNRAINMSHPTKIYITKADICPVDVVKIAVEYVLKNGERVTYPPMNLEDVESVTYNEIPGWKFEDGNTLPKKFLTFLNIFQEAFPKIKIVGIGTGPKREDIIYLNSEVHA